MASLFKATRRIEFSDTDMAGIVHFTAYLRYMESVEHEFLKSLEIPIMDHSGKQRFSWPRVAVQSSYQGSATYPGDVTLEISIKKLGTSSVTYQFDISFQDHMIATSEMTSVYCMLEEGKPPKPLPIPATYREKLGQFMK